jgi:hypothetical protein
VGTFAPEESRNVDFPFAEEDGAWDLVEFEWIMFTRTGGSGRKYSVYALARRLAIAATLPEN